MEIFETVITKDESGRLTFVELPFHAKEVFHKPKGTIFVSGTINGIEYRSKLLSRGNEKFIMILDKVLQKSIGYHGDTMVANVTMDCDEIVVNKEKESEKEPVVCSCKLDVLTAIKTRQSIRKFTSQPISEEMLNTILSAGLYAPTAKNKRPYHFIVIRDQQLLSELAQDNSNIALIKSAPCSIVVCGDKNIEGIKEFLYEDCSAATQNMLLSIHGLGLGGVWCGVVANSDWRKLLIDKLELPLKLEPIAVIAFGWPDEAKELCSRWDSGKIHYDKW